MAERSVLDLTTETERPVVTINGTGYQLRTARDLTLQDFKLLERVSVRVGELLTKRDLTKPENAELTTRLKEIADIAIDAPAALLAKLTDYQRVMVFKVFTELLTPGLLLAARAIQTPALFPGTKRSRGSSGSTQGPTTRPGRRVRH